MPYLPIENHALIGDMHTAALVGVNGCIDWLCLPQFDSPSIFASILDDEKGGSFAIHPRIRDAAHKQFYLPETNVLITRFFTEDGSAELMDFMPVGLDDKDPRRHAVIRRVTGVRGQMRMRMTCLPAFDYARRTHTVHLCDGGVRFESSSQTVCLATDIALTQVADGVTADFELSEGKSAHFILRLLDRDERVDDLSACRYTDDVFDATVAYWRAWISKSEYQGRWREIVERSLLALKLLTFAPTGAIIAAPTTSLPEAAGGGRNWDYRYTWVRDAAFTVYALLRLGFREEAHQFTAFLRSISEEVEPKGSLHVMYSVDGGHAAAEQTLDHLSGHRGSRPVRIGNDARDQLQLDIYGELIDSIYLDDRWGAPISYDSWRSVTALVEFVVENWQRDDHGIWEVRGGRRQFVSSKVMCWVALDRALRMAAHRSFPCDVSRWMQTRDRIYDDIMTKGWDADQQSFVMSYGNPALDASTLLMSLTMFLAPNDPRMVGTINAIMQPPQANGLLTNSLLLRYDVADAPDGLSGQEGTFNMCTFWLVEALTRAGRFDPELLDRARLIFERMLGFANHVGLYGEQIGFRGEALGNFPQAFTHLSLISAAYNLDRTLNLGTKRHPPSHT
jgi:GH15 family glucan-1,4-alpha-glucosidase